MCGREVNVWTVEDSEPAKRVVELVGKRSFLMSTWITSLCLLKTFGRCMMLQMADYLFRDRNVVVAERVVITGVSCRAKEHESR